VRGGRREPIDIFLETIALTIGALLPITNPFSTAPLFVSLTANFTPQRQRQQAFMACVYSFGSSRRSLCSARRSSTSSISRCRGFASRAG
jgi:hypothetical protein